MTESQAITEIAQSETKQFHQRQSEQFLDCAVNLMVVDFDPVWVARKLRSLAKHIEEHS